MTKFTGKIKIYIDGCSKGNPGHAACGIVIYDENDNLLCKHSEYFGEKTNQEAEYLACLKALEIAPKYCTHEIEVYSDSQLVVKQLNRQFRIKEPRLLEIHTEIRQKCLVFKNVDFIQVPRDNSYIKKADKLADEEIKRTIIGK
jgi:ribonuclease HI